MKEKVFLLMMNNTKIVGHLKGKSSQGVEEIQTLAGELLIKWYPAEKRASWWSNGIFDTADGSYSVIAVETVGLT